MKFFKKLVRDNEAATAIEYGLIAALISVAAIAALGTVGTNLTSTFTTVGSSLAPTGGGSTSTGG
ncbi:Flp family type IVb pilin [Sphingopyxis sp. MWB1]|uniref:Flp family type IVb pilin n=1 Tax=Sphingopyxis sp. MWB1 TaxID=1537715 RepID=UPI00051A3CB9|nr:Flp family type IVb pilin [Sphingopyxis sp. MWB1]